MNGNRARRGGEASHSCLLQKAVFRRTTIDRRDPASMVVIRAAAKSFGSPAAKANQPTAARQVKTKARNEVQASAAMRAQARSRSISTPQNTERSPKVPPESRAVFAPEGFDKNPATPHRRRKIPNPTNQRPLKPMMCGMIPQIGRPPQAGMSCRQERRKVFTEEAVGQRFPRV